MELSARIASSDGYYGLYTRLRNEVDSLTTAAIAWDQTFEHAIGTYPTQEFVAGYRAFADRALRTITFGQSLPHANAYELESLFDSKLKRDLNAVTGLNMSRLERMAQQRTPFRTDDALQTPWTTMLDPLISDLRRGAQLITSKLITMEPEVPATPNPGVPGSTPTYPGGPRPTPIP